MLGKGKDFILRHTALKSIFLQTADQSHDVHAYLLWQNARLREYAEHFFDQGIDAAKIVPADCSHKFGVDWCQGELHRSLADAAAVNVSTDAAVKTLIELVQNLLIRRGILLKCAAFFADGNGERIRCA